MKMIAVFTTLLFTATSMATTANAAVNFTNTGRITFLTSGWAVNSMRVQTDAAFNNPDACPIVDGYITDPSDAGTPLYHSILLGAFLSGKPISLAISGCAFGRPKIIGVTVTP
jgi:hypothetical protein